MVWLPHQSVDDCTTTVRNVHPVEIFDVTIRDGSYVVDFQFTPDDVRFLCRALEQAGFRYIEVGHGFGLNGATKIAAAASDDEYLAAAAETLTRARFGAFFIPGVGTKEHLRRARLTYGMDFIRMGDDPERIERTLPEYIEYARELGFEVMGNFMKSYSQTPGELGRKAGRLAALGCSAIYIVDSAGGMLPDEVAEYVTAVSDHCDARIGFHGHNNLDLASANALAAMSRGCTLIDCSIGGLGRSAGNTRTEMLIPALKRAGVPVDYDLAEILDVYRRVIAPVAQRHLPTTQDLIGGYARIHSGQMAPIERLAAEQQISVEDLLLAMGDLAGGVIPPQELEHLAQCVGRRLPRPRISPPVEDNALLSFSARHAGPKLAYESAAVDETIRAANVLAVKGNLKTVGVCQYCPSGDDEPLLMVDYWYHDEQFVVLRILANDLAQLAAFITQHDAHFQVFAWEGLAREHQQRLEASLSGHALTAQVIHLNRGLANYYLLFSVLHELRAEVTAQQVLVYGGDLPTLARHVPDVLSSMKICGFNHDLGQSPRGALFECRQGRVKRLEARERVAFDTLVLLHPLDAAETTAMLEHLPAGGTVVDCTQLADDSRQILRQAGLKYVALDLHTSLTAQLSSLLPVVQQLHHQPGEAVSCLSVESCATVEHPDNAAVEIVSPALANHCRQGAHTLVVDCAAVQPREQVLVIADASTRNIAEYVCEAARSASTRVKLEIVPDESIHGAEPPVNVAQAMYTADVIFSLRRMSLAHTTARKRATDRGARFLSLPDYSLELLGGDSLRADFSSIETTAATLSDRLAAAQQVEITSALGTRLRFQIGRAPNCCPGTCREPGMLASPPDAEVDVAPWEGTAAGWLWVDGSIPCRELGLLVKPIGLKLERGRIVDIVGPQATVQTWRTLFEHVGNDAAWLLAEFGIGLNPRARLSGSMLEDEGCAGTIHFGFGSNATIGGVNQVPFHLDFVIKRPTVLIDQTPLMLTGELLLNPLAADLVPILKAG